MGVAKATETEAGVRRGATVAEAEEVVATDAVAAVDITGVDEEMGVTTAR